MATLEAGEQVGPVTVQEVDGAKQTLSFNGSDKETLLFVFNTTCPACRQNQSNWKALYENLAPLRVSAPLRENLERSPSPVVSEANPGFKR